MVGSLGVLIVIRYSGWLTIGDLIVISYSGWLTTGVLIVISDWLTRCSNCWWLAHYRCSNCY